MRGLKIISLISALLCATASLGATKIALTDSLNEITLNYRTRNKLMIVPVMINDSIKVNMILDPNCRSIMLFGNRYQSLLKHKRKQPPTIEEKNVQGVHTRDGLSLHNKISIGPAMRENVPIVVLRNQNPFNFFTSVNGVIGYDILAGFELIIDHKKQILTIRSAHAATMNDHSLVTFSKHDH
jgi:hypothetical protein